jgi:bifunctional non-homologous end joining protein LigD
MIPSEPHDFPFTLPMDCLPVSRLPVGPGWIYELKVDGYRGQAIHDCRGLRLLSRNGKDFARTFSTLIAALRESLPAGSALDGELVAFHETGRPSFNAMQNASPNTSVVFFVFDVLFHSWRDVKHLPLSERLALLPSAFIPSAMVQRSESFTVAANRFTAAVRKMGGEGVVAKRLSSRYEADKRSGAWSKMRLDTGQEFVIGGFTSGNHGVDALVVGFYSDGELIYAARARAGLVPSARRELCACLKPLVIGKCPFANLPEAKPGRWGQGLTAEKMKDCIWAKPELVANFEFREWTDTTTFGTSNSWDSEMTSRRTRLLENSRDRRSVGLSAHTSSKFRTN